MVYMGDKKHEKMKNLIHKNKQRYKLVSGQTFDQSQNVWQLLFPQVSSKHHLQNKKLVIIPNCNMTKKRLWISITAWSTLWHPSPSKWITPQMTSKAWIHSNYSKQFLPWRWTFFLVFQIALTLCKSQLHFSFNNFPLKISNNNKYIILLSQAQQK